jgi:hypothetical protein
MVRLAGLEAFVVRAKSATYCQRQLKSDQVSATEF